MGNLSATKEKNIINCSKLFLEKNSSISINEINKIFPCKVCTIQDLYDVTSLKNGINIDLAADLMYKSKNIKIVLPENKNFENLSVQLCESLRLFGLNAEVCELKDGFALEDNDTVLILDSTLSKENYKNFLNKSSIKGLKIINILSEKCKNQENNFEITLYYLDDFNFDKTLCVEILLKSIYLGIMARYSAQ